MRKLIGFMAVAAVTIMLCGCPKVVQNARDTAAGLQGVIQNSQQQFGETCKADPTQKPCRAINKGVDGQNLLIDSLDTYCGWPAHTPPTDPHAACVQLKSAEPALQAAIQNAQLMITELKGLTK